MARAYLYFGLGTATLYSLISNVFADFLRSTEPVWGPSWNVVLWAWDEAFVQPLAALWAGFAPRVSDPYLVGARQRAASFQERRLARIAEHPAGLGLRLAV